MCNPSLWDLHHKISINQVWAELCFKVIIVALLHTLRAVNCTVRAPVFGRHQFFGTSEHYGNTHGSLWTLWMNCNCTACCWFPTSSNILLLPSQFWQIGFESYRLHCSKCRILVLFSFWLPVLYFLQIQNFELHHLFFFSNLFSCCFHYGIGVSSAYMTNPCGDKQKGGKI